MSNVPLMLLFLIVTASVDVLQLQPKNDRDPLIRGKMRCEEMRVKKPFVKTFGDSPTSAPLAKRIIGGL